MLSQSEGIIPALESAHAVYYGVELAKTLSRDEIVLVQPVGAGGQGH